MVAGQAIQTQAQTKEFDEGYERIFGKAKPIRGRFVYVDGEAVQVDGDFVGTNGERMPVFTDRYMEGVRAQDGTDISSRAKRRAYMKERGLCDADDISPQYLARQKAEAYRADKRARRQMIEDAVRYKLKPKGPPAHE